jgi:hypothetical protein
MRSSTGSTDRHFDGWFFRPSRRWMLHRRSPDLVVSWTDTASRAFWSLRTPGAWRCVDHNNRRVLSISDGIADTYSHAGTATTNN